MLLNQCLAISLSPADRDSGAGSGAGRERAPIKQSSALQLFQKLVEANASGRREQEAASRGEQQDEEFKIHDHQSGGAKLAEALERVEFAGFVVPSWLLISGSFNDLHCVKFSWSEGKLKPPRDFRIETIGNIRSVNVDYFGSLAEDQAASQHLQLQQQQQQQEQQQSQQETLIPTTITARQSQKQSRPSATTPTTTSPAAPHWQPSGRPEMPAELGHESGAGNRWLSVSPRLQREEAQRELSALELAIVESLGELSKSQAASRVRSTAANASGRDIRVQVADLIGQLEQKFERLPAIEYVDCAIGNLVDCGQLRLAEPASEQPRQRRSTDCNSLFANRLLSLSETSALERRQQLGVNCWSPPASRSGTAKSKSTTLDSGIQSLDSAPSSSSTAASELLQDRARETDGQVHSGRAAAKDETMASASRERRSFSLTRSLSLRPKRDRWLQGAERTGGQQDRRAASLARADSQRQRPQQQQQRQRVQPTGNLSSLFRSKSMRVVSSSSSSSAAAASRRQQHQGYANHCDHGDQSAGRLLNGYARHQQVEVPTIDYLATAHQHKRSFSIRRNSLLTFGSRDDQSPPASGSGGKILLFLRRLFTIRRARSRMAGGQPAGERTDELTSEMTSEGRHRLDALNENEAAPPRVAPLHGRHNLSPSSSSSSGSNSLIEILDCSPAVRDSRRRLRCEPSSLVSGANPNRATWRLLKRSDSSLSHHSAASCSTTKSTASQQLRRHLDEASRRHRHCTSQREKDFIDSINVLRQASRHALQTSRSPSKTSRQTKSEARSPASEAGGLESGSEQPAASAPQNWENLDPKPQVPLELDLIRPAHGELARQATECSHLWPPTGQLTSSAANCCICASYLSSAAGHLCPLGCCPTSAPPLATTCCLAKSSGQAAEHAAALLAPPDLCCPLWRSMVYNYLPPPPAADLYARLPLSPVMSQHPNFATVDQLDSFAIASHLHHQPQQQHHQQNQHNTTIDLKIEIGAEFQKKLDELSGGRRASLRRAPSRLDDSLDSDQTDESLGSSSNQQSLATNRESNEQDVVRARQPVDEPERHGVVSRQVAEESHLMEPDSCNSDGANSQSSDSLGARLA